MVSGIGPAAPLQRLNVPIISDLEGVGQNILVRSHTLLLGDTDIITHDPALGSSIL